MSENKRLKYLTVKEIEFFDAQARFDSVKAAAQFMGISPGTLYNRRKDLRKRYRKRRGWINSILAQTRRGGCLKNLLTQRNKMQPPDSEEDLDEEEF